MKRTAEYHELPLDLPVTKQANPGPTRGEAFRLAVGWVLLTCGIVCVYLVIAGGLEAWARDVPGRDSLIAYIVAGLLFLLFGVQVLSSWDWRQGRPERPVCPRCHQRMHIDGMTAWCPDCEEGN